MMFLNTIHGPSKNSTTRIARKIHLRRDLIHSTGTTAEISQSFQVGLVAPIATG